MNEQLNFLVELQEIDKIIDQLKNEREAIPIQIEKIKNLLEEEKNKIEELKKNLTQLQVERKNQEIELETREQNIRKHFTELNLVKTNEAYRALLNEIEKSKGEKNQIEEKILELMQKIEDLSLEIKETTKMFSTKQEKSEKEMKILEEKIAKISQEITEKERERENIAKKISSSLFQRYTKIRESKKGLAVVPIEDNHCGGCRMLLPPHLINEVYKNQTIVTCEVCSRILYLPHTLEKCFAVKGENKQAG